MKLIEGLIRLLGTLAQRRRGRPRDDGPVDAIVTLLGNGSTENRDRVAVSLSREEQSRPRRASRRTGDRQG